MLVAHTIKQVSVDGSYCMLLVAYFVLCQSTECKHLVPYAHRQHGASCFGIGCQGSLIDTISTRHNNQQKQHVTIFK